MAHQYGFREGWRAEHLAKYILSKFSFVAEPSTIADDLGGDFYCTLFDIVGGTHLFPRNSYAIQIKSKKKIITDKGIIDITNKKDFLGTLAIPFFVGVSDHENLNLEVYSGEAILEYCALGPHDLDKVEIELIENRDVDKLYSWDGGREAKLRFPKVLEVNAEFNYKENKEHINELLKVSDMIQKNIASRISKEHIFNNYNSTVTIYSGPGSYQVFRRNFIHRLAEVYHNLNLVIHQHNKQGINIDNETNEFKIFKKLRVELTQQYGESDPLIQEFNSLVSDIEEKLDNITGGVQN
jgi:hypothetical protein